MHGDFVSRFQIAYMLCDVRKRRTRPSAADFFAHRCKKTSIFPEPARKFHILRASLRDGAGHPEVREDAGADAFAMPTPAQSHYRNIHS